MEQSTVISTVGRNPQQKSDNELINRLFFSCNEKINKHITKIIINENQQALQEI